MSESALIRNGGRGFKVRDSHINLSLLVLRVLLGLSLFINHGWEKIAHFPEMASRFPNPIGVGKYPGLMFALLSDAICSVLVALGLGTRIASLIIVMNMFVAFFFFWKADLTNIDGELCFVYLAGYLTIFITGGGESGVHSILTKLKKTTRF